MTKRAGFQGKGWFPETPNHVAGTEVDDVDYNPSVLTDHREIQFSAVTDARDCIISAEDLASGSLDEPRLMDVIDLSGTCQASQAISITLEGGALIDGSSAALSLEAGYACAQLSLDGTGATVKSLKNS